MSDASDLAARRLGLTVLALCGAAVCAAFALPLLTLGVTPFWIDESMTVMPAQSIHHFGVPKTPFDTDFMPFQVKWDLWDMATPLYRYAVALFTAIFGFSEFTTRAFSLVMGACCGAGLFWLVQAQRGPVVGVLAATLLVTSPSFLVFAMEARHFTFVMALSIATLHCLHVASERDDTPASGLWFVFAVATLLSQTLGYMILPVAGLFVLACGPRRFFVKRQAPAYAAATLVYLAILALFWDTLPFFHRVACDSRPAGCQESPLYYLGVVSQFLEPLTSPFAEGFWRAFSLHHFLFVLGLCGAVHAFATRTPQRKSAGLLLLWFLVPLLLLSTRDVKFQRYLLIWALPPLAWFVAEGLHWAMTRPVMLRLRGAPAVALLLLVLSIPQLRLGAEGEKSLHFVAAEFIRDELLVAREDNFQQIRAQAQRVLQVARPDDILVTSFDDAGLNYYTGRFVHGFLNSRKTDEDFMALLDRARETGTRVVFMDTLPAWNFCLSAGPELRSVDCRQKYRRFYRACLGAALDERTPCVRLPLF